MGSWPRNVFLSGVAAVCSGSGLARSIAATEHDRVPSDHLHFELAPQPDRHRNALAEVGLMRKESVRWRGEAYPFPAEDSLEGDGELKQRYPYFHTSAEIRSEVQRLAGACKGALSMKTLEDSKDSSVSIDAVSIRAKGASPVNRIFILFGEHSRELISPESGLFFVRALCEDSDLQVPGGASKLLEDSEFQIVLNANPRSRLEVEAGNFCLRENPNGVDLNRNWDEKWERAAAGSFADANPGPRPFSEPETRIFRDLVTQFKPTVFLTVHSGTRGMYMPWAYDMEHEGTANRDAMMGVLRDLDKEHCTCPFGAAGKEVGYPCPGTCLDWVYAKLNTPFVFAFEIYVGGGQEGDLKQRWRDIIHGDDALLQDSRVHLAHMPYRKHFHEYPSDFVQISHARGHASKSEECFGMFNPDSKESYDKTVKNWASAYWQLSQMTALSLKNNHSTSSG
mmetsp:Transcript_132047/g.240238  ORF Transcript_132047/g.240238 Transcript_132047/m.240238 type:complete len:452 (+) Transcript_132047:82-1437(+)